MSFQNLKRWSTNSPVVRNIYGFELAPNRIAHLIDLTLRLYPRFAQEIDAFFEFLTKVYEEA